jgi:fermentation-respiration switch protein FrsA (DUF1100 family)
VGFEIQESALLIRWLFYFLIIYFLITLFAYFFSDFSIFPKPEPSYQDNGNIIKIITQDGAVISAVYLSNNKATYTVLISHGNGEDLGRIMPFLKRFRDQGYAIFAYDYHGYGTSTGRPSEKNAYADSNAAFDYLTRQLNVSPNHIIAYGRSLGAALAIDLAAQKPVAGLIVENPFVTAFRTVIPIPLLVFDKFNNLSKIKNVKCPLLVIHGKEDRVISFWHGEKLYHEANSPKYFFWVKNAGHNNVENVGGNAYWQAIDEFVKRISGKNK